jgi:hypothetical protein
MAGNAFGYLLVRRERMAREAIRRVLGIALVGVRDLLGMTLRARFDAGVLEALPLEVVAPAAGHLRRVDV